MSEKTFSVEILHIGWVNMYAPFYLNVMRYHLNGKTKVLLFNADNTEIKSDNNPFYKKAKEVHEKDKSKLLSTSFNGHILKEIRFRKLSTDTDIIKELTDKELTENRNKDNIFQIGLCEPVFLREQGTAEEKRKYEEQKKKLEFDIFINRLLLWGLADLALLKKHKLLNSGQDIVSRLFQTNISTSLETIKKNLKNLNKLDGAQKKLQIYTYPEGTTVYNEVQRSFADVDKHTREKCVEFILDEDFQNIYTPLDSSPSNPWIIFTAEPTKGFKKYYNQSKESENISKEFKNIGFVSSSTPETTNFTALICAKKQLENTVFSKFFEKFKETLQDTIKAFYQMDFGGIDTPNQENTDKLDLLEWEIYKNQRIYTFDIKKEAEKWKKTFEKITTELKSAAEKKDNSNLFKAENHEKYAPTLLVKQGKNNFIDSLATNILPDINNSDKDRKEKAKYLLSTLSVLHNETQKAAKKSAIAAIISRNMSHNLGSHVINYLKHFVDILGNSLCEGSDIVSIQKEFKFDNNDLQTMVEKKNIDEIFLDKIVWQVRGADKASFLNESLYRFLEYLNRRMEFIATMTTSVPSTPLAMNFDSEIWKPMVHENSFLVDFIAKSDLDQKMELVLKWELNSVGKDKKNLEVAIPDGVVGCHALYTIIENYIRNSAKHGIQRSKVKSLEITIQISEYGNDYYGVKIFDNLQNGDVLIKLLEKLQNEKKGLKPFIQFKNKDSSNDFHILNPRLIDETGNLIHQMWGIKEMFIGACFLRGFTLEEYNLKHDQLPVLSVGMDKDGSLVYNFYITKPKFLLTLAPSDCKEFEHFKENSFKDNGVDSLDYTEFEKGKYFIRHKFCLLHMCPSKELGTCEVNNGKSRCVNEYNNWIAQNENLLPYRIFCDCPHTPKDRKWVSWKKEWTDIAKKSDFNCLKNTLYSEWIKKLFYELDELPSLIIIDSKINKEANKVWKGKAVLLKSYEQLKFYLKDNKPKSAAIFIQHFNPDENMLQKAKELNQYCSKVGWEKISGGNATNHLIREVNESSDIRLRKHELIEACLASVVIIDERIYNNCDADLYDFNWNWRNVKVYNFAIKKGKSDEDKNIEGFIYKYSENSNDDKWIDLDNEYDFLKNGDKKTDFLVIHRGIIEKILETEKEESVDGLFEKLMKVANFIIVDSGRGKPDYISKSRYVRFVNLENLYQWFFDCKISLVRGLFSLINRDKV